VDKSGPELFGLKDTIEACAEGCWSVVEKMTAATERVLEQSSTHYRPLVIDDSFSSVKLEVK
jgi:hypothetical protein